MRVENRCVRLVDTACGTRATFSYDLMDNRSATADDAGVALWFDHLPSDPNRVSVSGESYESSDHMAKAPFQEASHLDSITLYVAFQSLFPTEELDKLRRLLADFPDQAGDDFPPWRMMWPGSSE